MLTTRAVVRSSNKAVRVLIGDGASVRLCTGSLLSAVRRQTEHGDKWDGVVEEVGEGSFPAWYRPGLRVTFHVNAVAEVTAPAADPTKRLRWAMEAAGYGVAHTKADGSGRVRAFIATFPEGEYPGGRPTYGEYLPGQEHAEVVSNEIGRGVVVSRIKVA